MVSSLLGEWHHGKIQGIGVMSSSSNGDVYEGNFLNNHYHGVGTFRKGTGDVYMGYSELGWQKLCLAWYFKRTHL